MVPKRQIMEDVERALMFAQLQIEDLIELEKHGHPSGYKLGVLRRELNRSKRAMIYIQKQILEDSRAALKRRHASSSREAE